MPLNFRFPGTVMDRGKSTKSASMKILHTSPPMGPSYGGPFQSVRNLAKSEVAICLDVEVMMPWSAEAAARLNDWLPVSASASGMVSIGPLGWSRCYRESLMATRADVIHTHGLWLHPSWAALAWKKKFLRPHVASVRGMLEPWAWQHKAWKKRPVWWIWEKRNLESASLLHATSAREAESFRSRGLSAPIAIIPNGVELVVSQNLGAGKVTMDKRVALFLGRMHPIKGLPLLLDAWAKLRPKGWCLRVAGPDQGGYRKELERQVTKLGLEAVVRFTGPLAGEDKDAAFRDADLFILPTLSENFGIAVAEAMAHGLPVITTHGAPWQLLEDKQCGWWVPVSVEGIAAALHDATRRSPEQLAAMGAKGREIVAERFAWDRIAAQFNDCYRWLLGEGERPDCVME